MDVFRQRIVPILIASPIIGASQYVLHGYKKGTFREYFDNVVAGSLVGLQATLALPLLVTSLPAYAIARILK